MRHIHARLGRCPVLYTNGTTALHIAENRDRYPLLSRLPLWYARYKPAIGMHFPKGNWQTYALWQFSAGRELRRALLPLPGAGDAARHRRQRRLDERRRVARRVAVRRAGRRRWPGPWRKRVESVPLPIPRRTALEGGDVTVQYADVAEGDEQPTARIGRGGSREGAQPSAGSADMPRPSPP